MLSYYGSWCHPWIAHARHSARPLWDLTGSAPQRHLGKFWGQRCDAMRSSDDCLPPHDAHVLVQLPRYSSFEAGPAARFSQSRFFFFLTSPPGCFSTPPFFTPSSPPYPPPSTSRAHGARGSALSCKSLLSDEHVCVRLDLPVPAWPLVTRHSSLFPSFP